MVKRKRISYEANSRILKIMITTGIVIALVVSNVLFTMATGKHFRSGKDVLSYKSGSGTLNEKIIANRGYIYDRNKEIVAQDIEAFDLVAVVNKKRVNATSTPAHVENVDETCEKIAPILNCSADDLKPFLNNAIKNKVYQTEFGSFGKGLSAQQKEDIENLNLAGLEFNKSASRVYPTGTFASQMVGYAQYNYDADRIKGVMGMENIFDDTLKGKDGEVTYKVDSDGYYLPDTKKYTKTAENGSDVYLTIDKNVQLTLEKALKGTMEDNASTWALGIVMEAKTGKILAQAGYPTFDLNERETIDNFLNAPSQYQFEPGSVMKPFVYAGAMQAGTYNGSALFDSGSISLGYDGNGNLVQTSGDNPNKIATINDALGNNWGMISLDEGLIHSANTAIVDILTKYYSTNDHKENLKNFGFFQDLNIYGLDEEKGKLNEDSDFSGITLGFGQGSTINAYQLIQGFSALFTDGNMVHPFVVDRIVNPNTGKSTYVGKTKKTASGISEENVKKVQALLKRIVSESYGTAHQYEMSDITMMAKTGTGEVVINGGYSTSIFTSSIIAAAPAEDPEIVIYYAFQSPNYRFFKTSYFQDIVREGLLAVHGYNQNSQQSTENVPSATFTEFTMPSLMNHSLEYANSKLNTYTKNIIKIGDGNTILSQYPLSDTQVVSNQRIFLLSDGTNITMPNMSGWSRKDIKLFSKLSGIDIKINGSGTVVSQSIGEAISINKESQISVEMK